MKKYLVQVTWTAVSSIDGKVLLCDKDLIDVIAKDTNDLKSKIKALERVESFPPRSETTYKVTRIWEVNEIELP